MLAADESDPVQSLLVKLKTSITGTEPSSMTHLEMLVKFGQVTKSATGIKYSSTSSLVQ